MEQIENKYWRRKTKENCLMKAFFFFYTMWYHDATDNFALASLINNYTTYINAYQQNKIFTHNLHTYTIHTYVCNIGLCWYSAY